MHRKTFRLAAAAVMATAQFAAAAGALHPNVPTLSDSDIVALQDVMASPAEFDDLAAAARTLTAQQVRAVPAYRDLYKTAFDRLIPKLLDHGELDPDVRGFAARVVATYEALYADTRWSGTVAAEGAELLEPLKAPWSISAFNHPLVAQVDYPDVLVRQATWDSATQTLLFALQPQEHASITTTFHITNIPTNFVARLEQDGRQIAAIDEHGQASGSRVANLGPGEVRVTVQLEGTTQFAIRPE